MKIAILTSGVLPVPAVQGGAVENLIDFYLEYNDRYKLHDITIYSIWHTKVTRHPALKSEANHYHYIKANNHIAKLKKLIYRHTHSEEYYHYTVECFFEQAYKHLCQQAFDIIILENRPGYALKLHKRCNLPLIYHLHNDFLNSSTRLSHEIYDAATRIINISQYISRQVATIEANDKKSITVHNAIDIKRFRNAQPIPRNTINLTEEDFVIAYSGRLIREKGILQLLQAFKQVEAQIPNLRLLIIGANAYGSNQRPTPFIQQLEKEVSSIRKKVIFTGFIGYEKMPSYLKTADIAVIPSMWEEPFGLTVVEAMAAGLPLITTRSGGIPEICEGIATIIDKNESTIVSDLANAILDQHRHPEKQERMAKASLQCSAQYDKEKYARDFFAAIATSCKA